MLFALHQDVRKREACTTYSTGSTSVRDIQFEPHHMSFFRFASADEGGNLLVSDRIVWSLGWN